LTIRKYLIALFVLSAPFAMADDGWVSVPRPERVIHQFAEEDRSIWVVFAKSFGSDRILLRFPEDPTYRHLEGRFEAMATHLGNGEMCLLVRKKVLSSKPPAPISEVAYRDADTGHWVRERHIETDQHQYILRMSHPMDSAALFRQFADSFEITSAPP
jgi:hypothetical protein